MSSVLNLIDRAEKAASDDNPTLDVAVVFGVPIVNMRESDVITMVDDRLKQSDLQSTSIFFANAHTLNLAADDLSFRELLCEADYVFGDGTGVRWAARQRGMELLDNVNGTDLIPRLLSTPMSDQASYFMLGSDETTIANAAKVAQSRFPHWRQVGFHHGFVQSEESADRIVEQIHSLQPDVLLVGMGNPIQERWIMKHRHRLNTKICFGVGGLFDFWSGNFSRAPQWLRNAGHEWLWRLWQQPVAKFNRYLVGNPAFLCRSFIKLNQDKEDQRIIHDSHQLPGSPRHYRKKYPTKATTSRYE